MIVLMIAVMVLAIGLLAVAPSVYQEARREREEELLFRGQQYARAIYLFQQHFNRYPNSVKELLHTNNMSFLRKDWPDPMTPGGKWRFIHVSGGGALLDSWTVGQQSKLPFSGNAAGGLNGSPGAGGAGSLGGSASASAGAPSGSSAFAWPPPNSPSGSSGTDASSQFGAGFGLSSGTESGSSGTSTAGSNSSGTESGSSGTFSAGSNSSNASSSQSGSVPGRPLDADGKPKKSPDCAGTGQRPVGQTSSASSSKSSSSSAFGFSNGPQGLGIAGVASCSDQASLRVWNSKKHYSEWEFLGVGFNTGGIGGAGGSGPAKPPSGQGNSGAGQPGNQPGNVFPAGQPPEPPTPDPDNPNPNPGESPNPPAPDNSSNPPAPANPPDTGNPPPR